MAVKKTGIFATAKTFETDRQTYKFLANYIHAKNTLKTVLGRLEAEINGFFCFDKIIWNYIPYMDVAYTMDVAYILLSKLSKKSKNFRKGSPVDKEGQYENVPECTGFPGTFSQKCT